MERKEKGMEMAEKTLSESWRRLGEIKEWLIRQPIGREWIIRGIKGDRESLLKIIERIEGGEWNSVMEAWLRVIQTAYKNG